MNQYDGAACEAAKRSKANAIRKRGELATLRQKNRELTEALRLHLAFLDSCNKGWLGGICCDLGLLNRAYLASTKALKP
jgi:hypothetical protein